MLARRRVLLIVSGSVAAYKALELARLLGKAGAEVTGLLTGGGARFVTPHALQAITGRPLAADLWSLVEEGEGRGHIRLARTHDIVVVAPASADRIARMAAGFADDLAGAVLLAWDGPLLVAPAMNPTMWGHPATNANVATLLARGVTFVGPEEGPMAEAESGVGRLSEPPAILAAIERVLTDPTHGAPDAELEAALDAAIAGISGEDAAPRGGADRVTTRASSFSASSHPEAPHHLSGAEVHASSFSASWSSAAAVASHAVAGTASGALPLAGRHVIVTSGPTHEPLDPVRYIANRSSGKQGHAIAGALAALGARVTLVAGPVNVPDPQGVEVRHVETAREMLAAVEAALPADAAVMAAAVADWRPAEVATQKVKKGEGAAAPPLALVPNPDILATLSRHARRPRLVVGFAAETERVVEHACAKLARKGCDWIVANDVSGDVMGGDANAVHLVSAGGVEDWPRLPKGEVAARLADRVAEALR
ncbi:bifunctional phosphopantothenoylcysteine decarboxylase/phosphopantothenate synthase [Roseomonas sp. CCTCC AB2023176]|uniref:bifunctional phosphopantothenoylcysteine decarboxylase/phosphopantothenate synthase n=1 Tax=Roseomonas sp. CCTCC AB2023176 TaxID=3342640 RepID=UPI0035DFDC45